MTTSQEQQSRLDKVLRVIRALKAKAEGTNNEAEAAAFAAKAAEMMAQYGLEEAQLSVEEQSGIEKDEFNDGWSISPARKHLASAVCRLYMVRPILTGHKNWTLVGRKHNIVMCREMMEYLVNTTQRLSSQWKRENGATEGQRTDFKRGCFVRLTERIGELRKQQEQAAQPKFNAKGNPENLPALYQQEKSLVDRQVAVFFPNLGKSRRSTVHMGAAASHGYAAGGSVSLNRQVGGASRGGSGGGFLLGKR